MKHFDEIAYERISYEKTEIELNHLINNLNQENDFQTFIHLCKRIISIQNHVEEMCDYADIKNMRNCSDSFFQNEMNYWNVYKPKFNLLFVPFYESIMNSKHKDKLSEMMPDNFFHTIAYQLKISSDDIVELQQKENELMQKYRELSKNKIMYDSNERSISYISGFCVDKDRMIRKKAHDAINDYYYTKQKEYDDLLYDLITTRNLIAKKLGFDHYVNYSLYKLRRFEYDYKDIHRFREYIIRYIIPLCKKTSKWQKNALSLEKLEYFDAGVFFHKMPTLKYYGKELLDEIFKSFEQIDSQVSSLFYNMIHNDYIDLLQRDNKVGFAITNYLTETCLPVITGNFKNNYLDVQTTAHEMGHAFQKYCASIQDRKYIVSALLKYPTMEIAEIFSYAMELISMDYFDNLFNEEDYVKYCFMKIYNMVNSLPYICLVDEFQERIYSNEDLKVEDIRKTWLELVTKYQMETSNTGHINLETGGYFYRQSHIYLNPFYYIDYALSSFGALAIWDGCKQNIHLFKEIGAVASYYCFRELIKQYNMPNPFDETTVKCISERLGKILINLNNQLNNN